MDSSYAARSEREGAAATANLLALLGALHVAIRDNIEADELIVETAYQPDPELWKPDFKTRRTSR